MAEGELGASTRFLRDIAAAAAAAAACALRRAPSSSAHSRRSHEAAIAEIMEPPAGARTAALCRRFQCRPGCA